MSASDAITVATTTRSYLSDTPRERRRRRASRARRALARRIQCTLLRADLAFAAASAEFTRSLQ